MTALSLQSNKCSLWSESAKMLSLRVLLLSSLCLATASADDQRGPPRPPPRPAANCQEDTDCPAYHWCETHYIGLGQWNGRWNSPYKCDKNCARAYMLSLQ